jgi:hypothetical protein
LPWRGHYPCLVPLCPDVNTALNFLMVFGARQSIAATVAESRGVDTILVCFMM